MNLEGVNSWAFQEAVLLHSNIKKYTPEKKCVLFETGYGPSGFPHIGTFGEVVRTVMVRQAFTEICKIPTKLLCVSDDMDSLRKIPENISQAKDYTRYLDFPLTSIPDPYNQHKSYGDYMNMQLCKFLDRFSFDYEFISATKCYKSGIFNKHLKLVLEKYDEIVSVLLPTLGDERRKTYSPFLPICKTTGRVLQAKVIKRNVSNSTITYIDSMDQEIETSILYGACKLQWKVDFAMRWSAFDVDYEIYGKDIQANSSLYNKICVILGKKPPVQMNYELFLDENGHKISKSKGNGVGINEWLRYGSPESLKLLMYQSPKKAKKICFDIIPKTFDNYLRHLSNYGKAESDAERYSNPAFFICQEKIIPDLGKITYSLLLNLIIALNSGDKDVLWGYIESAQPNLSSVAKAFINDMLQYTLNYYNDFIVPKKKYKAPNLHETKILHQILEELETTPHTAEDIQTALYKIARESGMDVRECFRSLYQILLGVEDGPRLGTFINFYGITRTVGLIKSKL